MNQLVRAIRRQLYSPRFWGSVFVVLGITVATTILLLHTAHPVLAVNIDPDPGRDEALNRAREAFSTSPWLTFFGTFFKGLVGFAYEAMGAVALGIASFCSYYISKIILPGQNSLLFADTGILHTAWSSMLQLANIIFFVALFVFSVMIITRQAGYNFKKAVVALITAAAMANLSMTIVRLIVEAGDALRNSASKLPGIGMSNDALSGWLNSSLANLPALAADPTVDFWQFLNVASTLFIIKLILAYIFVRLLFLLGERAVRLIIITIFAPLQAALGILPQKELQNFGGGNWIGEAIKWTLVLPATFILIGIAMLFIPSPSSSYAQLLAIATNIPTGAPIEEQMANTFGLLAGLGILLSAASVPKMLGTAQSAIMNTIHSNIDKGRDVIKSQTIDRVIDRGKTKAGIHWENFKRSKVGQALTAPARAARTNEAVDKAKLESIKKLALKDEKEIANTKTRKAALRVINKYDDDLKIFIGNQAKKGTPEYDQLKEEFKQKNINRWKERQRAENTGGVTAAAMAEEAKSIGAPLESTFADIEKSYAKRVALLAGGEKIDSKKVEEIDAELVKQLIYANGKIGNSPEGERWGKAMSDFRDADPDRWEKLSARADNDKQGLQLPVWFGNEAVLDRLKADSPTPAYQALANTEKEYQSLQDAIIANTKALTDKDLARTIATTDERTLRIMQDDKLKIVDDLSKVDSTSIDAVGRLSKTDKREITQIITRTDLLPATKKDSIEAVLQRAGIVDAATISETLSKGVGLTNLKAVHTIARGQAGVGGDDKATVNNQISNVIKMNDAQTKLKTVETHIKGIPGGPGYASAVRTATTGTPDKPAVTTATALTDESDKILQQVTEKLKSYSGKTNESLAALGLDPATHDDIAKLLQTLKMEHVTIPGHSITNGTDAAKYLTIDQVISIAHKTKREASSRPRF